MKHLKRFAALLMTFVMVLSLSTTAFAAGTTGKITVENTVKDASYSIYRIFDLESYNATSGAYAYKVNSAWAGFFTSDPAGSDGTGRQYVNIDEQGYVTWKSDASAADFAAKAIAFAKTVDATIAPVDTKIASGDNVSVVFDDLPLGYYLVDSSLGALCALTTTNPEATVVEKNTNSSLDKQVKEDSTGTFGKTNDADIGQTVEFKAIITVQGYAKDYVMHDKMDDGLTYKEVTSVTLNDSATATSNYTVKTTDLTDGCTFEVVFTKAFCDTLKSGDKIEVCYTAILNDKAVVSEPENNNAHLSYKDENNNSYKTEDSNTKTYTWDVDVLKYANGDEKKVLQGAEFVLLNSDKTKVATVVNGKVTGWADVATAGEGGTITWPENSVLTTDAEGKISVDGLDADTYYLREIKAPEGYNKLDKDTEFKVKGATKAEGSDTLTYETLVVKINNQSGTELPSTGGMGTTIFYAAGSILVLAAVVLLVTRKRMDAKN